VVFGSSSQYPIGINNLFPYSYKLAFSGSTVTAYVNDMAVCSYTGLSNTTATGVGWVTTGSAIKDSKPAVISNFWATAVGGTVTATPVTEYFRDSFTAADNTSISGRTPDVGGGTWTSDSGPFTSNNDSFASSSGLFTVGGETLNCNGGVNTTSLAHITGIASAGELTATVALDTGGTGNEVSGSLIFRLGDTSDYLQFAWDWPGNTGVSCYKNVSGSFSVLSASPSTDWTFTDTDGVSHTFAAGQSYGMRVVLGSGGNLDFWFGGWKFFSASSINSSQFSSNTGVGLKISTGGSGGSGTPFNGRVRAIKFESVP
jgi:hypothetical protein